MRPGHPRERAVGIEYYVSETDGTGGRLRADPEAFRVRERESFAVDLHPPTADPGSYPHLVFRATLRRWDTNDFASQLSDRLGISRERVSWAGTKDKHAVTTQLFSVRTEREELPSVRDADVEVLGRAGRPVLFGDLLGNDFEIRVEAPEQPTRAEAIATELRVFAASGRPDSTAGSGFDFDNADPLGVPNYFGSQRFGSLRPITHRVGLDIVRGDFESAAVRYVCETSESEPERTSAARRELAETRAWHRADELLPGGLGYERAIASRLTEGDETTADHLEALQTLPSNLQTLLVNAAQSYAFNLVLSERLDRGLPFDRPVAGDVVCFADDDGLPDPGRTQRVDADRVDTVSRHCERGRAFVTAPLVGTDTEFADGEIGAIERSVCSDLGIEPADFALPGAFDSDGTRRAILLTTDLSIRRDPLRFSFGLPKGAYATVVLREFLKCDPIEMS
ncbi:MAG: tRNA pseudouridine(13) synthase TruD [Natronomonas sp.]